MMLRNILLFILLINSAFAQNSVTLKKGQVAQFDGHLVKKERLEKLVKAEKSNVVLKDLGVAQDELIEYHKHDARVQRRKLSEAKFGAYMTNIGAFVVGVLVTSFAFKVNQKIGEI